MHSWSLPQVLPVGVRLQHAPAASARGAATAEARIAKPSPLAKTPTIRLLDITAPDLSLRSEATTRAPKVAMWSSHIAVKLIGHSAKRLKNGNLGHQNTTAANAAQPMTAPPRANPMQKAQRPSLAEIPSLVEIKWRPHCKTRINAIPFPPFESLTRELGTLRDISFLESMLI
jgi:hypothetical protein